jgi:hypothetical protein
MCSTAGLLLAWAMIGVIAARAIDGRWSVRLNCIGLRSSPDWSASVFSSDTVDREEAALDRAAGRVAGHRTPTRAMPGGAAWAAATLVLNNSR